MSHAQLQTDWLLLNSSEMAIEVKAIEADSCHICGQTSWHDRAGYGFQVQECSRCLKMVCESHAETDYDLQDDPPRYVCTQWVCGAGCEEENYESGK